MKVNSPIREDVMKGISSPFRYDNLQRINESDNLNDFFWRVEGRGWGGDWLLICNAADFEFKWQLQACANNTFIDNSLITKIFTSKWPTFLLEKLTYSFKKTTVESRYFELPRVSEESSTQMLIPWKRPRCVGLNLNGTAFKADRQMNQIEPDQCPRFQG